MTSPENIDWLNSWKEKLMAKDKDKKDWNKAAKTFHKRAKRGDYHELLFSKLILSKEDTVLDLGCGEGSITLPIAKQVKHVTGLDSSEMMLELLKKRASEDKVDNIDTILKPIEEIYYNEIGSYDIVIASRSLNSIKPIDEVLTEIDKIASKYVFITFFGPDNWKIEKEFYKFINKKYSEYPDYNYLFNILFNLGIYANIERLDIKKFRTYSSIDEAMENSKFRPEILSDDEKIKLREYLSKTFKTDDNGRVYNEIDKADWVLFWWKKD